MSRARVAWCVPIAFMLLILTPAVAGAQEGDAQPIDHPPGFGEVRDRFENLTPEEIEAAGYVAAPPECISSPAGGMGVHALNRELAEAQFPTGEIDPQNPPLLLLDATMTRVVGLEWETAEDAVEEPPVLFGQTIPLLPGHPGIPEPHYMLHAYFRPNDQVLFAEFDPELSCDLPATDTIGASGRGPDARVPAVALLMLVFVGSLAWRLTARAR